MVYNLHLCNDQLNYTFYTFWPLVVLTDRRCPLISVVSGCKSYNGPLLLVGLYIFRYNLEIFRCEHEVLGGFRDVLEVHRVRGRGDLRLPSLSVGKRKVLWCRPIAS